MVNNTCNTEFSSGKRKLNKPLIEKRRRERINRSLVQLKRIVLEATGRSSESALNSKLEKADILEMTVQYLENINKNKCSRTPTSDTSIATAYRIGYALCSNQATKYLEAIGHSHDNRQTSRNSSDIHSTTTATQNFHIDNKIVDVTNPASSQMVAMTTCYPGNSAIMSSSRLNMNTTCATISSDKPHTMCNINLVPSSHFSSIPVVHTNTNSQSMVQCTNRARNIKQEPCVSPSVSPSNQRYGDNQLNREYDNITPVNEETVWRPW